MVELLYIGCIMKLPYEYISKELDKLYEKKIDYNDTEAINAYCEFIAEFIKACGWNEDDYIKVMMEYDF